MRKSLILILWSFVLVCLVACDKTNADDTSNKVEKDIVAEAGSNSEEIITNTSENESTDKLISGGEDEVKLVIQVGDEKRVATFENNSSAEGLIEKLKEGPITIDMSDYGSFEKVGALGFDLPRNDKRITTKPGDVILYQGDQLTIYYDTNSWNFTKIAVIDETDRNDLVEFLGDGDVRVTLSIE